MSSPGWLLALLFLLVNLAARLESVARPGQVVIGEETARRLPSGSVLDRLPDQALKGKTGPIQAHRLMDLPGSPE